MPNGRDVAAEDRARRAALAAVNLFETDPEMIEGLVYPVPADRELARLLRDYDTERTTNRKVRCAICPTHTKHFRGFVGQLNDGTLALIGIDCGEKRFGKGVWAEMSAQLKREQDEAHYQARIAPALKQIEVAYPLILECRSALEEWSAFRAVLAEVHDELFEDLREAAQTAEGRLAREQMTWVTVVDENGEARKERQPQTIAFGRIPFPATFISDVGDRRLRDAGECLKNAHRILKSKNDLKSLAQAFRILREGRKAVEDAAAFHRGWIRNSSLSWWSDACRWFNSAGASGKMRLSGRRLIRSNAGDPIVVRIPESAPGKSPFDHVAENWPQ